MSRTVRKDGKAEVSGKPEAGNADHAAAGMEAQLFSSFDEIDYRRLFENSSTGIYRTTLDGRFVEVNAVFAKIFGYATPEQFLGEVRDAASDVYADPAERNDLVKEVAREGISRNRIIEVRRRDGQRIWVAETALPRRDPTGRVVGFEGFVEDVTSVRQMEQDLERRELALRQGSRLAKLGHFIWNMNTGRYLFASEEFVRQHGGDPVKLERSQGAAAIEAATVDLADRTTVDEAYSALREEGCPVDIVYRSRGEGEYFMIVREIAVSHQDALTGELHAIGVTQDITGQRLREDELRRSKEAAEATLQQLQEAQWHLLQSSKMAFLSELVAGVSHDINTPLGLAVTLATHIREMVGRVCKQLEQGEVDQRALERNREQLFEAANMLLSNCQRAAELIKAFKRIAVDQASGARRSFNLSRLIEDLTRSMKHETERGGHRVVVDCPRDLELDSYPGAVSQVLSNLMMNSVIHGFRDRKGTITIRARAVGAGSEGIVRLECRDDGAGISVEDQRRIFDPFFTTRHESGGTGLGLSMVYQMVTGRLGGQIAIDSEHGEGTTFTIEIPRLLKETAEASG